VAVIAVNVRQLDPAADLDALEPLFADLHAHQTAAAPDLGGLRSRDPAEASRRRISRYREWLGSPGAFCLFAEDGEAPIGYLLVTLGPPYDGWESGDTVADLRDFVVSSTARGRGVGTKLLAGLRERLASAGVGEIRVHVVEGNEDAMAFYLAQDFEEVGRTLLGRT
jgi:ribosomal protein S18 acetylase RimI-like enzyme